MILLLPDEGEFEAFEQSLDAEVLAQALAKMETREIKLYVPRFSYSLDLADTLAGMGMADAFDGGRADLALMYDRDQEPRRLFISRVVHKAFVAVDEEGTEAAAATGIAVDIVMMTQEVWFDRPFIYAIQDTETGTILFLGRVIDPRG